MLIKMSEQLLSWLNFNMDTPHKIQDMLSLSLCADFVNVTVN
jgi:hypothetical protein